MPTPQEPSIQVADVRALRAPAHPLRNRLLGLLRLDSPSTATPSGHRVGESSGLTSYHLRQLAAYGFAEEAEEQGSGREWWSQARHRMTSWETSDLAAQEDGAEAQDEMQRLQLDAHARVLRAWQQQRPQFVPAWNTAAFINDYALRLTPEQARRLADELIAVATRWMVRPPREPAG